MNEPNPEHRRPVHPARIRALEEPPRDDLSDVTSAEERIAMVAVLSRRMWELTGRPWPGYTRSSMPVELRRLE